MFSNHLWQRKHRSSEKGFTLLEMIVALFIFSLTAASMAPAFVAHLRHNHDTRVRTAAIGAAQQKLEELRSANPQSLPSSGSDDAETIASGGYDFSVVATYCSNNSYCSTKSRHITVEVTLNGKEWYSAETVYTQLR